MANPARVLRDAMTYFGLDIPTNPIPGFRLYGTWHHTTCHVRTTPNRNAAHCVNDSTRGLDALVELGCRAFAACCCRTSRGDVGGTRPLRAALGLPVELDTWVSAHRVLIVARRQTRRGAELRAIATARASLERALRVIEHQVIAAGPVFAAGGARLIGEYNELLASFDVRPDPDAVGAAVERIRTLSKSASTDETTMLVALDGVAWTGADRPLMQELRAARDIWKVAGAHRTFVLAVPVWAVPWLCRMAHDLLLSVELVTAAGFSPSAATTAGVLFDDGMALPRAAAGAVTLEQA